MATKSRHNVQTPGAPAPEAPAAVEVQAEQPAVESAAPVAVAPKNNSGARVGTLENPMDYEEAMAGVAAGTIKRSVFTHRGWLAVEPPKNPHLKA